MTNNNDPFERLKQAQQKAKDAASGNTKSTNTGPNLEEDIITTETPEKNGAEIRRDWLQHADKTLEQVAEHTGKLSIHLKQAFEFATHMRESWKAGTELLQSSSLTWLINFPLTKGPKAWKEAFKKATHIPDEDGKLEFSGWKTTRSALLGVPAAGVALPYTIPVTFGGALLKNGFNRAVFDKDETGKRSVFNPKRAAVTALAAGLVVAGSWVIDAQTTPIDITKNYYQTVLQFQMDAVAINMTHKQGIYSFGTASEAEGAPGVFYVRACDSERCVAQENITPYMIRDSAYLDFMRLVEFIGDPDIENTSIDELHDTAQVAGAFDAPDNICYVEYWSGRMRTPIEVFPKISHAECESLNGRTFTEALEDMREIYMPEMLEMPATDVPATLQIQ